MISESALTLLGIQTARGGIWKQLHSLSADTVVFVAGAHVALNWRWIVGVVRQYIVKPVVKRIRIVRALSAA